MRRRNPTQLQIFITDDAMVLIPANSLLVGWRLTFDALKTAYAAAKPDSDRWWQIQSLRESYRSVSRGWSVRCDLDREVRDLLKVGGRLSSQECIGLLRIAGPVGGRGYDLRSR